MPPPGRRQRDFGRVPWNHARSASARFRVRGQRRTRTRASVHRARDRAHADGMATNPRSRCGHVPPPATHRTTRSIACGACRRRPDGSRRRVDRTHILGIRPGRRTPEQRRPKNGGKSRFPAPRPRLSLEPVDAFPPSATDSVIEPARPVAAGSRTADATRAGTRRTSKLRARRATSGAPPVHSRTARGTCSAPRMEPVSRRVEPVALPAARRIPTSIEARPSIATNVRGQAVWTRPRDGDVPRARGHQPPRRRWGGSVTTTP